MKSDKRPRRGEVPFVAIRVGRSNDPREVLALAQELKILRATALGYVALWEEFLLEVGDALSGRLRGYTAAHISAKLGWEGKPNRIVDALRNAGLLKTQRGVFFHPYWKESITGQYANERAELRAAWREKKRRQRDAELEGAVPGTSQGHVGDVPPMSPENPDIEKERKGTPGAAPPPSPPGAGGGPGEARWEWLKANHRKPMNSRGCIRILDTLSDDSWALCQWVVAWVKVAGTELLPFKKRATRLDSYQFLLKEAYLQFLPERRAKLEAEEERVKRRAAPPPPTENPDRFLLERLADPEVPEKKKTWLRNDWEQKHPGQTPPWATEETAKGNA